MAVDIQELKKWVGRSESATDTITSTPVAALAATLDLEGTYSAPGQALRPLWHWLYFLPTHRQSELGPDGHAKRGGFLPPVPLPRRMWAGGQFEFLSPICIGDKIVRTSTVEEVAHKSGRSGELVFVKVRHEFARDTQPVLKEIHNIVYRDMPRAGDVSPPTMAPAEYIWKRDIVPDDVLLFRYSALTFNGHRIHYDRRYVTEVEGYPGLIVHGPLIATLLLDLLHRHLPGAEVRSFEFKALRPTFDIHPFSVCARQIDQKTFSIWGKDHEGALTMDAVAVIR